MDLIGKPWQRLTKYKLLLYAVLRPLDGADPMFDADEQKKDIGVMVRRPEQAKQQQRFYGASCVAFPGGDAMSLLSKRDVCVD